MPATVEVHSVQVVSLERKTPCNFQGAVSYPGNVDSRIHPQSYRLTIWIPGSSLDSQTFDERVRGEIASTVKGTIEWVCVRGDWLAKSPVIRPFNVESARKHARRLADILEQKLGIYMTVIRDHSMRPVPPVQ